MGLLKEKLSTQEYDYIPQEEILKRHDSLTLAYIGDCYYSLYIRKAVFNTGIAKVHVLHDMVSKIICAKTQCKCFLKLEPQFTTTEQHIARRARNTKMNIPSSATQFEYRCSTALEAVLGYLYLKNDEERLKSFCKQSLEIALED